MDRSLVAERFALLSCSAHRAKMARFRDVFSSIQAALEAGVTRAAARDELAKLGLDLTYKTFTIYLDRVRKERRSLDQKASRTAELQTAQHTVQARAADPDISAPSSVPASPPSAPATHARAQSDLAAHQGPPASLPDDWRTCPPSPELAQMLTPEQKKERRKARDALYCSSPYDLPMP